MTFHNMAGKITNTYMDTEDTQENDEEEELLRIRYEEVKTMIVASTKSLAKGIE